MICEWPEERDIQSHDIAKSMRLPLQKIGLKYQANIKLVEVPPGPPVLSTIVAEIYGPDYAQQIIIAKQVEQLMKKTSDVVDIDWMVEDDQNEFQITVDKEKAMLSGVATGQITATVQGALSGMIVGKINQPSTYHQVPIKLQLRDAEKNSISQLLDLQVQNNQEIKKK
ncbi:MAG: acriflavin resistance protein [Chitinophagaceae bacterium]|nr:MAG: acriflavin resistance protein [Chitinophagaceae bacterium]